MNFIPELLLALVILCLCGFLGVGVLIFFELAENLAAKRRNKGTPSTLPDRQDKAQRLSGADALLTGDMILIGLAVTAHVAAVFTGQSFSRCTAVFMSIVGVALLFAAVMFLFRQTERISRIFHRKKNNAESSVVNAVQKPDSVEKLLTGIFWILVAAQLTGLLWNAGVYAKGDMTVETVGSFLQTDGIYRVNPMTGQAYTEGIPSRLKILCLPSLYGFLSRLWGLTPERVVTSAVPIWVFVSCYAAFFCVGKSLFPENRKKRWCFLITTVIIIWAGSSFYSMDGFDLLYCGYRGVTIRNLVIIPYLISLCLRKKWISVILCILAEACIVWTLYGLGACLLITAGLILTGRRQRHGGAS